MAAGHRSIPTERARPRRSLGQNFLVDGNVARKIVDCLKPTVGEHLVEIGPGKGMLTRELLRRGGRPLVLEKDLWLAQELKTTWPELAVVAIDALRFDWPRLASDPGLKIIGNLPYNIASPLIWRLVESLPQARGMVFTVQREVADRLVARAGTRIYGGLSVWVQSFAEVRRELLLSPHVFRPRPRVDSAVVGLQPKVRSGGPQQPAELKRLIHLCFQKRRKQLGTILRPFWTPELESWLAVEGLTPTARPEDLSPSHFNALSSLIKIS